ncbi:MAG: 50S ribosomal protein L29 [Candidatus Nanoarchaeia archaeon]
MNEKELNDKKTELQKELMKILTQKSSGGSIENPGKIKSIKKTLARINMFLHNKGKITKEEMKNT